MCDCVYQLLPPSPILEANTITNVCFRDVSDHFLSRDLPLGQLGRRVKHLSFSGATLGEPEGCVYSTASDRASEAAQRWMFCVAVSKLSYLKYLNVELEFWAGTVAYGWDVTALWNKLPWLVVETYARVLCWLVLGNLMRSEHQLR